MRNNIFIQVNSLVISLYLLLVFCTPLHNYSAFYVNIILMIIWLLSANVIDRSWYLGFKNYIYFIVLISLLDLLLSISLDDALIFKQCIAGKLLAYFSFFLFLFYSRHLNLFKTPLFFLLVSLACTSVYTYVGNMAFPNASRALADPSNVENEFYRSLYIGGYEFIYSLVLLIFPLIASIKYRVFSAKYNWILIPLLLFFILNIVVASYFIGICIMLLSCLLIFIDSKSIFKLAFTICIIATVFFVLKDDIFKALIDFGESINSQMLKKRATQILYNTYEEDQGSESRTIIYYNAVLNFFDSPLWGKLLGEVSNRRVGHSGLLEYLSNYGVLGLIYFISIYKIFRTTLKRFSIRKIRSHYYLYFLTVVVFFLIDIFDFSPHICLVAFFISPCLFLIVDNKYEGTLVDK